MNENLDLTKILKDCPKGTKLYSPMLGEMEFIEIYSNSSYPIIAESKRHRCTPDYFTKEGKYVDDCDAQCMLFPSKDNNDWSTFKINKNHLKNISNYFKVRYKNDNDIRSFGKEDVTFDIIVLGDNIKEVLYAIEEKTDIKMEDIISICKTDINVLQ